MNSYNEFETSHILQMQQLEKANKNYNGLSQSGFKAQEYIK